MISYNIDLLVICNCLTPCLSAYRVCISVQTERRASRDW